MIMIEKQYDSGVKKMFYFWKRKSQSSAIFSRLPPSRGATSEHTEKLNLFKSIVQSFADSQTVRLKTCLKKRFAKWKEFMLVKKK